MYFTLETDLKKTIEEKQNAKTDYERRILHLHNQMESLKLIYQNHTTNAKSSNNNMLMNHSDLILKNSSPGYLTSSASNMEEVAKKNNLEQCYSSVNIRSTTNNSHQRAKTPEISRSYQS